MQEDDCSIHGSGMCYSYCVEAKQIDGYVKVTVIHSEWKHWKSLVPDFIYNPSNGTEYISVLVPNIDNVRTDFLIHTVAKQGDLMRLFYSTIPSLFQPVLLLGEPGTAKTVMLKAYTSQLNPDNHVSKSVNFSSATSPFCISR
ncbi:dynein heavy chain 5, axonemal [Caerostris extrusa]|uniref:Dynein heavy chain 5, axonemal n=1 Tax=Caerostris extrusa TaxID=172846 RepID=A0AAV4P7F7_CAEEX|nr:dynein heavy chain 5, axonemal [Caerostris extrusa]